ncbi:TPA: UDP-N-acetylglucosamine 1-carboxyvinyltransferase [Candidatus Uhrbacteria bacterium]|nr:UDP-N-acetylglucosamine 1-carboxyvinyltransferase [Candidatus Uhrbacteria bacterium]
MPSTYHIVGGKPLNGTVEIAGAKNASSKMLLAALLTSEPVTVENVPRHAEIQITTEILNGVGAKISWPEEHTAVVEAPNIVSPEVTEQSRKNRLSVLTLAPLLHRVGEAFVPVVGGDKIGPRPVNFHLDALKKMGALVEETPDGYRASVEGRLKGTMIELPYPSVGATETVILAGVLAEGRTVIKNAAIEPEIMELVKMLQKMGAIIEVGIGRQFEIIGVEKLNGCQVRVMPDRNEAVSYACMALGTNGEIFVKGAVHGHLINFLNAVRKIGGTYEVKEDGILFKRDNGLHGIELETDTHPGFMTDWQQPFSVVLTQASGTSVVHETVYEERFGYTEVLNAMGADITLFPNCLGEISCRFKSMNYKHSAVIKGPSQLKAAPIVVPDIRAGLAFVIAALVAEGESVLTGIEHLDRGYERLEEKLRGLGANIQRVETQSQL